MIHGVHGFIQKGLEMSKKVPVGCRGSPGVSRASLQSSRRVWGCFREDLECLGGPWVGSVVFWKGLKMSQETWGVQSVLMWVWGVLEPSRRVWGCPREDLEGLGGP